jgi:3-hydroxyacyl-CoA dehydrogenase
MSHPTQPHYELQGAAADGAADVAVVTLSNPPVNGLGLALRRQIHAAVTAAQADDQVRAIVLIGSDKAFSGGADIRELGTPAQLTEPLLRDVLAAVENSAKPVVAAISGVCLGGGLELALACQHRVALATAQLGLPEVKLGLIPGSGGTQRLPRLLPLAQAADLVLSGRSVSARSLAGTALLDQVVDGDRAALLAAAVAFAQQLPAGGSPRTRDRALLGSDADLADARAGVAKQKLLDAPRAALQALEAVLGADFDAGLQRERELFLALQAGPQSRALRHLFQAERLAAKVADLPGDTPTRAVRRVGVVGAGTMGTGIALNFIAIGLPVVLVEAKDEALQRGLATLKKHDEDGLKKGRFTAEQVAKRAMLVTASTDYAAFADCDLVIEAVFEDMAVKHSVFRQLDAVCKPGAILASNTSTLDVGEIAAVTARPADVVGLHFFSPAHIMKLLEIVRVKTPVPTAPEVLATALEVARQIGKKPVVSGVCDGFIGNRMLAGYFAQANQAVLEGAEPTAVDRAIEGFGLAMGPLRMNDLAGIDIGWASRKRRSAQQGRDMTLLADRIAETGRFGQKTGSGWYRYEAGNRTPQPEPQTDAVIAAYRQAKGVTARAVGAEEIVERCIYALVAEGARILDEGIAQRASDIDVVYTAGYGFPVWRGGPMAYAQEVGWAKVVARMGDFAAQAQAAGDPHAAAFWTPSPWLQQQAAA